MLKLNYDNYTILYEVIKEWNEYKNNLVFFRHKLISKH